MLDAKKQRGTVDGVRLDTQLQSRAFVGSAALFVSLVRQYVAGEVTGAKQRPWYTSCPALVAERPVHTYVHSCEAGMRAHIVSTVQQAYEGYYSALISWL